MKIQDLSIKQREEYLQIHHNNYETNLAEIIKLAGSIEIKIDYDSIKMNTTILLTTKKRYVNTIIAGTENIERHLKGMSASLLEKLKLNHWGIA